MLNCFIRTNIREKQEEAKLLHQNKHRENNKQILANCFCQNEHRETQNHNGELCPPGAKPQQRQITITHRTSQNRSRTTNKINTETTTSVTGMDNVRGWTPQGTGLVRTGPCPAARGVDAPRLACQVWRAARRRAARPTPYSIGRATRRRVARSSRKRFSKRNPRFAFPF